MRVRPGCRSIEFRGDKGPDTEVRPTRTNERSSNLKFKTHASIEGLAEGAERDGDTPKQADVLGLRTDQRRHELHGKEARAAFNLEPGPKTIDHRRRLSRVHRRRQLSVVSF